MPIVTIDLHGNNLEQAQSKLVDGLLNALSYGERVVRIIHGQGKHSEVFPVIKSMVRHWLAESEYAHKHVESIFRGEDGSPYTTPNPGETIVVLRNSVEGSSCSQLGYEEEEQREKSRNSKKVRADRLRTLRRRRF